MNENSNFYEIQRFRQWWLWLILIFILGITIYNIIDNHEYFSTGELIASAAVTAIVFILFFMIKLETKIDDLGIQVRFFPFHLQYRYFPWKKIKKVSIRSYSPITEYGGWGLRFGMFGRGKAYNISGNIGLQLVFKDGKKLLIGTQKSVEMKQFLKNKKLTP
ncbi:hypothetical protein [Chryseobacterium wangxinyae]|uniref:hypothetical protein n=1 Tax=Chryseobacterium sp. CY353 TaxID=2997334 RepID=UPI00227151E9|nr:hypothetical protein [Chryseobacterium sp. CY353]MCY0967482.1 hypothetical protein [Chryseobacterium sp. CY353]